jgi:hypothetical protein
MSTDVQFHYIFQDIITITILYITYLPVFYLKHKWQQTETSSICRAHLRKLHLKMVTESSL